ncbi:MAG: hypothetical protein DWQ07_16595 [Chloroflexi bacterium]|nr:MAG: hypothetical protein DWQ07_16595 [Chloroflexota bacterium]MBL1195373.1 hypothetical protein [Chloroflexota bacterium]NOH12657.1 hypothetical protein [Chloroflexota bacterium]
MQTQPQKRKLILFSLVLMLASLACLCTSGITDLIESNVPDEVTIIEEVLPTPEISDPLQAPEEEPQGGDTSSGNSISTGNDGLAVIDTNFIEDDFGTFSFLILVENTGSVGLEFVEASVTLKDGSGTIVSNENAYSSAGLIEPGGRSPLSVNWYDDVPAWETFELFVDGDEVDPDFAYYYTDFEVTSSELTLDEFDNNEIVGEVQNTGDATTNFVSIVAILYDAGGRIIGEGFTSTDVDILQPGDTSTFTVFIFGAGGEIDSYDLIVQGSEATE